ncbi:MAG: hypothetical protein Ct9H300mP28_34740 [Pseudomonadota bacterium]|nr:MAG: hypothetical protein Ct9H300mP28_34740 [Pseudomonadota bacterium]
MQTLANLLGTGTHLAADGLNQFSRRILYLKALTVFCIYCSVFWTDCGGCTFAIIPIAGPIGDFTFQVTDVNPGLLFIFAITSLNVTELFLRVQAQTASLLCLVEQGPRTNDFIRSLMGLALMGVFMVYGTTRVSENVNGQNEYWFGNLVPMWGILPALGFILFFTALVAETKRAPFDAPEGNLRCADIFLNIQVCAGQLSCCGKMFHWWELQH